LSGNDLWRVGVCDVEVVDSTGCGDAFDAGLINAALRGADVPQMLTHATALGGSCARAIGCYDGIFTAAEADEFVREHRIELEHTVLRGG
jgi:sugar/nucleoside kinase (ribokinase family)